MLLTKKTVTKIVIHGINISYICIFITNWIYEIISNSANIWLIMSRIALGGLLLFLIFSEITPKKTKDLF
jgi:hypothetical protein